MSAQLLGMVLVIMGVLLFKNRRRAKNFISSFASFELVLAFEVRESTRAALVTDRHLGFCDCTGVPGAMGHSRSNLASFPPLERHEFNPDCRGCPDDGERVEEPAKAVGAGHGHSVCLHVRCRMHRFNRHDGI